MSERNSRSVTRRSGSPFSLPTSNQNVLSGMSPVTSEKFGTRITGMHDSRLGSRADGRDSTWMVMSLMFGPTAEPLKRPVSSQVTFSTSSLCFRARAWTFRSSVIATTRSTTVA